MQLLIFGATGATGRHVVDQALARGHRVTRFVRTVGASAPAGVTDARGDATDPRAVDAAFARGPIDAVIGALGARSPAGVHLLEPATANIVDAMRRNGVRRIVQIGAAATFPLPSGSRVSPLALAFIAVAKRTVYRGVFTDIVRSYGVLRACDLDWTILQPPQLTNGSAHGYTISADALRGNVIARADLASALLDVTEHGTYLRAEPFVWQRAEPSR